MSAAPAVAMAAPPRKKGGKKKARTLRRKANEETMAILVRAANHLILKDRFSYEDAMEMFRAAVMDTSMRANDNCKKRAAKQLGVTREYVSRCSGRVKELVR